MSQPNNVTQFIPRQQNPFNITFSREKQDGKITYTTTVRVMAAAIPIVTTVDEAKFLADGLDERDIVRCVKGEHYNKITGLLHDALAKSLKVEAV